MMMPILKELYSNENFMTRTIAISGLAGFIGFHTAKALCARGLKVVGFDNLYPIKPAQLKLDRLSQLKQLGIECETIDLVNKEALQSFFDRHLIDGFIHLAAQAGVRQSIKEPMLFINSNIVGFVNLLEVIKQNPKIPLVYASSSSIYGMNRKSPFAELDQTDQPVSLYGATKKSNELIAYTYHHLYKIPMVGLRFFTVYGPWGRPDMAYWLFTEAIFKDKPIRLFNEGKMIRDFTYVSDIVDGILASLDRAYDKGGFHVYNLGGNRSYPLLEFVEIIEKAIGKKAIVKLEPMQPGDVLKTEAEGSLSQNELEFIPKVSLEKGLSLFVDWYRKYHS